MLLSTGAMGAATLTSRLLGMVREMVYAHFMGTSWVASAFVLAFQIPNLFRRLLGEGALTAVFIPIFKEKETLEGERSMWHAANAVISGLVVFTCGLVALGLLGVSLALALGGQEHDGQTLLAARTLLMLRLLRVMMPYLLLVCLAAVFMGMLNARGHFFIPAMGATMLNVVMIASVVWLAPAMGRRPGEARLDEQIFGLAVGVLIAGVAQAMFQLPTLFREGFRYRWVTPWQDETVRRVVRQMLPAVIGVAAFQINVVLTLGLSFWVEDYIVASFQYAVRLLELPQGVFGISLATYLLPTLSGLAAEKNYDQFRSEVAQGMGYLVFINLLASVLLLTLAEPILRLLFERGAFDSASTDQATLALTCLAPSLVFYSLVNVLARAFYALGDTTTPMRISVFCLALNLVLVAAVVGRFKQGGLGAANTVTSMVNVALLFYALRRKLAKLEVTELRRTLFSMLGAALMSGLAAWLGWRWWAANLGHATLGLRLGEVFLPLILATLIYFGLATWLKVGYAKDILALAAARLRRAKT